jgi:hypothetical protein
MLLGAVKLSCFGVFNSEGIKVYTLFEKPFFLPWETIVHYGTITKKSRFQTNTYVYFSVKALVTAPYEPMPKLCDSAIYFSYQTRLRYALLKHWDSVKARKLIHGEDDKKRRKKKSMLQFCIGFYFAWLFSVLFTLTGNYIWLFLMVLLGVYIFAGVIWMIHSTGGRFA